MTELPEGYKQVLDKGYVGLVDHMGTDLTIVNAARVSYNKKSKELDERDIKLLTFLMREGHTSVLRHATLTFECYAPLMVARQWFKHAVGSTYLEDTNGWNESSRRYVTEDEEFFTPKQDEWRSKPENSKQGSGEPVSELMGRGFTEMLENYQAHGVGLYESAMASGIAPEQARLFIPANGMYVRFYWTVSLAALLHFLDLRDESHAQHEIMQYARAIKEIIAPLFPETLSAYYSFNT